MFAPILGAERDVTNGNVTGIASIDGLVWSAASRSRHQAASSSTIPADLCWFASGYLLVLSYDRSSCYANAGLVHSECSPAPCGKITHQLSHQRSPEAQLGNPIWWKERLLVRHI